MSLFIFFFLEKQIHILNLFRLELRSAFLTKSARLPTELVQPYIWLLSLINDHLHGMPKKENGVHMQRTNSYTQCFFHFRSISLGGVSESLEFELNLQC